MGKLMKYEIKGSYRFILGVLATTLILSLANYMYLGKISNFTLVVDNLIFLEIY